MIWLKILLAAFAIGFIAMFWIIINVVAIFMYYLKGLNFTVGLFTVYLVFAVYGFFTWRKEYLTLRA